nr:hypothetical protein CFP56_23909 [Quercus suber]
MISVTRRGSTNLLRRHTYSSAALAGDTLSNRRNPGPPGGRSDAVRPRHGHNSPDLAPESTAFARDMMGERFAVERDGYNGCPYRDRGCPMYKGTPCLNFVVQRLAPDRQPSWNCAFRMDEGS